MFLIKMSGLASLSWALVLAPLAVPPALIALLYLVGLTAVTLKWFSNKADRTLKEKEVADTTVQK
jgi:hypothetical protein